MKSVQISSLLKNSFSLLFLILLGGCGLMGETAQVSPTNSRIVTPTEESFTVLLGSPMQVQSIHANAQNISKVELWIQNQNEASERLIRADAPQNGVILQEWIPQSVGQYTIKVRAWDSNGEAQADLVRQVEVVNNPAIAALSGQERAVSTLGEAASFNPQAEPETVTQQQPEPDAEIAFDATINFNSEALPEPTTVPSYPPPPAAPGVPPGPTQYELNNFGPPICNAAEYEGVYSSDTRRRVMITEPDEIPADTVGGTVVHRAWRLRNVGTCTWGPGYELAFYGGRAMGSGGVSFENTFPTEPPRRNVVLEQDRLIVPEGKPNQTAAVEVMLQAPTTPGIHQSYWRMRDPHGVYFGPIIGVTMNVVRKCEFGIYGAPVINRFRVLIAGKVYNPIDPIRVTAELGDPVTLDWDVINADNFDIVFESPTGEFVSTNTTDSNSRATFTVDELGEYAVSLYADNGSCTVDQRVTIDVIPPYNQRFVLNVAVPVGQSSAMNNANANVAASSALSADQMQVKWNHFNKEISGFTLVTQIYTKRRLPEQCLVPYFDVLCYQDEKWELAEEFKRAFDNGGNAQGMATVSNVGRTICDKYPNQEYQIRYIMAAAQEDGRLADPPYSNTVTVDGKCSGTIPGLGLEIPQ